MPLQFEEATIRITGPFDGQTTSQKEYPGKVAENTGLGYWIATAQAENEQTFYTPIHIPSGYKLGKDVYYEEPVVQSVIEEIAALWDWNRSLEQLVADPGYSAIVQKVADIIQRHVIEHPAAFEW